MKAFIKTYLKTKWPAILWSVFVFVLLAMPLGFLGGEHHVSVTNLDKIVHIILFGILVYLWGIYLHNTFPNKEKFRKLLSVVILLAVLYGIAMEYVQLYTGRDFDVLDMLADAMGAVAGALVVIIKNKPR